MNKFGFEDVSSVPDCWVVNVYEEDTKYIPWHADDDDIFDAVKKPANIVSLSFGADALFAFRCKTQTDFASRALNMTPRHQPEHQRYGQKPVQSPKRHHTPQRSSLAGFPSPKLPSSSHLSPQRPGLSRTHRSLSTGPIII